MSPYSEDRLPGHERRRRELLAMLDTPEPSRSRALMPGIAAGAVLAVCTVAILAAQPWRDPRNLSPAGPVAGQDPTQGVPADAAKPGDPVPWDVANRTLAACLGQGRMAAASTPPTLASAPRASGPSPSEIASGWPASSPPGSGSPGTLPPPSMGDTLPSGTPPETGDMPMRTPMGGADATGLPRQSTGSTPLWWPTAGPTVGGPGGTGGPTVPPTWTPRPSGTSAAPDRPVWKVREPDAAFKPYFTAWEQDWTGALQPFVLGKAGKPDLVVCHGEQSPPELPAPTAADGTLAGVFEVRRSPASPRLSEPLAARLTSSTTWWGRTTGAVARVVVELPDGSTRGAVVRNGVWLANVPGEDIVPVRIRAYDAAGTLLHERAADPESLRCADAPTTKACGRRTHWG
ncbi:hypothetical protein [Embleya sp. NPDC050493]|uniref:hypothetical protein n=1 Tax=Embleya sp. NPDC050493 TaxID=3363989 RepID=UPI0037B07E4A